MVTKARFLKKLEKIHQTDPSVTLKDIVSTHHIRFRDTNKASKTYNMEIAFDRIDKAIIKSLSHLKISDKDYQEYVNYRIEELDKLNKQMKEQYSFILLQLNRKKSEKTEYMKKMM